MSDKLDLDPKRLIELKIQHKTCRDKKTAYKINAIILLAEGWTYPQIEKALLISERNLRRYRDIFLDDGLKGLMHVHYQGSTPKLSDENLLELENHVANNIFLTAAEVCIFVQQKYSVEYKTQSMVKLLGRLGFVYKKTKLVPGKADPEKQKVFLEEYLKIRKNLKENEVIYFTDSVHPTHNVMPANCWIKKGTEKHVKSNSGRERLNITGAYNPINQDFVVQEWDTIDGEAIVSLYKGIEESNKDKKKIIVIGDNAPYMRGETVCNYLKNSRIEFRPLPSYSPNLNLIERLWKLMKQEVLYNRYYETITEFRDAIYLFFRQIKTRYRKKVKSLLAENFHLYATV